MSYKNPLTYLIPFLFIILLTINLQVKSRQQFVDLARSFQVGSFSFTHVNENISDYVLFNDKYYWPLGPFPAVLLVPFVLFFKTFYQSYLSFPLAIIDFYLIYKITKHFETNQQKSLILTIFMIFGSIFTPLLALPGSWYFAQTVAATLLICAIYEFLNKKRYFLIGLTIALATATRFNLIFSSLFFLIYLFKRPINLIDILKFISPIVLSVTLLGVYNYERFGNALETGYNLQIIYYQADLRRAEGLFSIKHIPANLYYMLFQGPEPVLQDKSHELIPPYITFNNYGLSLFFLSPILLLIFLANYKKELVRNCAISITIMLIPIITYYGIGQKQVSYRYAMDFFPFIYLIIIYTAKKISIRILYPLVFFGVFFAIYFSSLYLFGLDKSI